jgi:serine/threonine-protein kinase
VKIGVYEVLGELGRGGTAIVYRAHSPEGREVAVKLLQKGWDLQKSAAFERELRLLWSFSQADGFIPVLDSGIERGKPFLVMPFLHGGTLRKRLRAGRLPIDDAVSVVARVAQAMARAHERGIVHRDLKPENVIFDAEGVPYVADLGLAKHFRRDLVGGTESGTVSGAGLLAGTPGYMAPEQLHDAGKARPQADVFALGVILHEALTGETPFGGEDPVGYGLDLLGMTPAAPSRVRAEVPRWLDAVVARALQKDEAARYAHAGELARALGGKGPRGRRRWAAAVVVGLVAAALPGAYLVARTKTNLPSPPAPNEQEDARAREARALVDRGAAHFYQHDMEGAIANEAKAIELDPKLAPAWFWRGQAYLEKGDLDRAIADETRAIELDPEIRTTYVIRGLARGMRGDNKAAIEDLTKGIALLPDNGRAWAARASAEGATGDLEHCIVDATKAIELEPTNPWAWQVRATARLGFGDADGAIADATMAIEIDPRRTAALELRAKLRASKGDQDGAIADLSAALELGDTHPTTWLERAIIYEQKGDLASAIADIERFLEIAPDDGNAPNARAALEELRARAAPR